MEDFITKKKFLKAVDIAWKKNGILFVHDYGEMFLSWESITHAFAVVLERKNTLNLPLFVMVSRSSESYLYIDGNTISLKRLKAGVSADPGTLQLQSITEMRKVKEEDLKKILREICSHFTLTYFNEPLVAYLKGSSIFLPKFSKLRDIDDFCRRIISSVTEEDFKGASIFEEVEKPPEISTEGKEREEWNEGSVLEGQYTVQQVLRGAMGTVYIVFDSQNVKFHALKTFQERHLWDELIVKRFIKEAEIWIKLGRHPNIVQAQLVKEIEGKPYILLEYVQGTDLDELLKEKPLTLTKSIELSIQFCYGMEYAFKTVGLIHRDIKPSNCLITREGTLKITDFGLGKVFDETMPEGNIVVIPQYSRKEKIKSGSSTSSTLVGTLPFMAPELFSNIRLAGVQSDIYAFGIMLYMMLTGINPFQSDDPTEIIANHLTLDPDNPRLLNPQIPDALSILVLKCIDREPRLRYGSFEEVRRELEQIYRVATGADYRHQIVEDKFTEEDWLNMGNSLASLGRHREALITFEQAIRLNPGGSLKGLTCKASSLIQIGRILEALSCLEEGMRIDRDDWEPWYHRGEALWKLERFEEALASFDQALELTEDKAHILGRKGKLLMDAGKYKEALLFYNMALSQNPRDSESWCEKGNLLIKMGRFEPAIECQKKSIDINPRNEWAWFHKGTALYHLGHFSDSIAAQEKALILNANIAGAWICTGNCHWESGEKKKALEAYRLAIEKDPSNVESYRGCIQLTKESQCWEEALGYIDRALDIEPENSSLLTEKAEMLCRLGFYREAESICSIVQEMSPLDEDASMLSLTIDRYNREQIDLLKRIKKNDPIKREFCYENLNNILCIFLHPEEALQFIERDLRVDSPNLTYLKACLYFIDGDYRKSLEMLESAQDTPSGKCVSPRFKALLEERGEIGNLQISKKQGFLSTIFKRTEEEPAQDAYTAEELLMLGIEKIKKSFHKEARALLRSALQLAPHLTICVYFMGKAYELEKDISNAEICYREFENYFPCSIGFLKERLNKGKVTPEIEEAYHTIIGRLPYDYGQWIAYLTFLSHGGKGDKIKLILSWLLDYSLRELDLPEDSTIHHNIKGLFQLILGRNRQAILSFTKSLEITENITALLGIGKCYEAVALLDKAEESFRRLMKISEDSGIAHYMLAETYIKMGLLKKPIEYVENALKKRPDSIILMNKKAQILADLKSSQDFLKLCSEISSLDPDFTPVRNLRALSLIETHKANDAIIELQNLLSKDTSNVTVLKNLAFACLINQNMHKAMTYFDSIISLSSIDYEAHLGRGIASYYAENYERAIESLKAAAILNPTDPVIWQFLGATNFHLRRFQDSEKCWDRSLRYKSRFIEAWINKGNFLYFEGEYVQAHKCAQRALLSDQENYFGWLLKARCQWKTGQLKEAITSTEKALSINDEDVRGWTLMGLLEFYNKRYELSHHSFEKALTLEPRIAELWYNRALLGFYIKNPSETRKSIARSLALKPDFFEALIIRFIIDMSFDAATTAKTHFERARDADPERFNSWYLEYQNLGNPVSPLKVVEITGDPFTLPSHHSFAVIEPIEPLDFLNTEAFFL